MPVVWPGESPFNWSIQRGLDLLGYGTQKAGANGAARGLREEILPYLKHKVSDGKGKTKENITTKISIMCHSMGNYVLKKMAPEEGDNFFIYLEQMKANYDKP